MTLIYPRESNNVHAPRLSPAYKSTVKRSPTKPLVIIPHTLFEPTGPVYGHETVRENDNDLTIQHQSEPLGERIIVHGHVRDEDGRGVPNTLLEVWQANACGRYIHVVDQHPAPLDPNFTGAGRAQTDKNGYYRFVTIKPGAYPWGNHHKCVAAGPFPLLGVRPFVHLAHRDADVFPRRPAVRLRSDLQLGDGRESTDENGVEFRPREHEA
jgi:protocatechuate 3,4-dioxygenase beta subunit